MPPRLRGRDATLAAGAVLVLGAVAVGAPGTFAAFTARSVTGGSTFTAASVDVGVSPTTALLTYSGMKPGDTTTGSVTVSASAASSDLRYAVSSSATDPDGNGLEDALVLTVRAHDVTMSGTPCDDFDGPELYSGPLAPADGKILGDSGQGADPGDRHLAPGASETLCFRVTLPASAPATVAGSSTTATFTFDAEQTANNP